MHRASRRLCAWIATLAVLMAALAPAISQAVGARGAATWIEVCTAGGSRWIASDPAAPAGEAPAPGLEHALDHCPYCSLHAPLADLPPAPAAALPDPGLDHVLPRAFLQAPRTLHAWRQAQPRAPPLVS